MGRAAKKVKNLFCFGFVVPIDMSKTPLSGPTGKDKAIPDSQKNGRKRPINKSTAPNTAAKKTKGAGKGRGQKGNKRKKRRARETSDESEVTESATEEEEDGDSSSAPEVIEEVNRNEEDNRNEVDPPYQPGREGKVSDVFVLLARKYVTILYVVFSLLHKGATEATEAKLDAGKGSRRGGPICLHAGSQLSDASTSPWRPRSHAVGSHSAHAVGSQSAHAVGSHSAHAGGST